MLPERNISLFPIGNIKKMRVRNQFVERDREATEKRLLDTIGRMVHENGFEKIGINAVALQAGVSKVLIYRYFGSVEGLLAAYIRQHDFWINFPHELPAREEELPDFLKKMFRGQIIQLRDNPVLRRMYRWELSSDNDMIVKLREQREKIGVGLVRGVAKITGYPEKEVAAMASILTASVTYLVMLEDFCPFFNGIHLDEDVGWEQISLGMDKLIDQYFSEQMV